MNIIAFIIDYSAVDRIINHLKLHFSAERPRPPYSQEQILMVAGKRGEYS